MRRARRGAVTMLFTSTLVVGAMAFTAGPALAAEPASSATPPRTAPAHNSKNCTGAGISVLQNCSGGYASYTECEKSRKSNHVKASKFCSRNRSAKDGAWYYGWWQKALPELGPKHNPKRERARHSLIERIF